MTLSVTYLSDDAIARRADELLFEFVGARGGGIEAPIPIEEIVEKHLKLRLEFDDLNHVPDVPCTGPEPEVLGAICFDERTIFIDERLDPEERPASEGRYRFTLAHEAGHDLLHREQFLQQKAMAEARGKRFGPAIVCRKSQAKERIEWQADCFSSCLLMPRSLVHKAWSKAFSSSDPLYCELVGSGGAARPRYAGNHKVLDFIGRLPKTARDYVLGSVARELAPLFLVSARAMRIRLEQIGLVQCYRRDPLPARRSEPVDVAAEVDGCFSRWLFNVK